MNSYFVYMMSNYTNSVLYIGVTNDLVRRTAEHKSHIIDGFTNKYNCNKLVYYEEFENISDAIQREKQLKRWHREWKNNIVATLNPQWSDLAESIGITEEIINSVIEHYKMINGGE